MIDHSHKWLTSTEALAAQLSAPDLVVLDAVLATGDAAHAAEARYRQARIPGAVLFDIEALSDPDTPLPHMLLPPGVFAAHMRRMGIGDGMRIVIYDAAGMATAARAWWMFRVMGHNDVAVLDGGLAKWQAEGRPLESGAPAPRGERHFTALRNAALVRDLDDMKRLSRDGAMQIVDARSAGRFAGRDPEPRAVPRLGHIPGSCNLPYTGLLRSDGTMKPAAEIRAIVESGGIDPAGPVVTTCGSGVTACVLALGLAIIGHDHAAVYDGSWAEWSADTDAPVES